MLCEKCGHKIGVEELKCPHCGADNPFALQHEQNMQQYDKRFDKTGKGVLERARSMGELGVKAAVIVILIIGSIITSLIESYNYSDHDDRDTRSRDAVKYSQEYTAELDELIENGEYMESVSYMYSHGIMNSGDEAYDELRGYKYVASDYYECMQYIEEIVLRSDNEEYFDHLDTYISGFCMYLEDFRETYEVWAGSDSSVKYHPYIQDLESELRTAMGVYFSMDEDEVEEFLSLSEAAKAVKLEEVFRHE